MRMLRLTFILVSVMLLGLHPVVKAQSYYTDGEIGVSAGLSQYFGDLNDNYGFRTVKPALGGFYRYKYNSYLAFKASFHYTQVSYNDNLSPVAYNRLRNLNFTSNIFEVAAQAEFHFFRFIPSDKYYRITPYLTGGIGAFSYDPYTTYRGIKYTLREQGTEGQNIGNEANKYTHITPFFPIGVGVKYWLTKGVILTFEVTNRLTTTDYLDDVSTSYVGANKFPAASIKRPAQALQDRSTEIDAAHPLGRAGKQRGNSSSMDQYGMAVFSVSMHFSSYHCPANMRRDLISTY